MNWKQLTLIVFLTSMLSTAMTFTLNAFAVTAPLNQSITANGMNQGDLWQFLENIENLVNEIQTDHATTRAEQIAIGVSLADYKAIYDAHTHEASNSNATAARTSTPDTGAAENSLTASAASAFTDTSGSPPAALTENTALNLTP